MTDPAIDEEMADELISVCRTVVGDELRSMTYFTPELTDQLYLRSDLERTADLTMFAGLERNGFQAESAYKNTQLGKYLATVRMFENGFLTRVIEGNHGIWVTTDSMSIDRFEELQNSVRRVLAELATDEPAGTDRNENDGGSH